MNMNYLILILGIFCIVYALMSKKGLLFAVGENNIDLLQGVILFFGLSALFAGTFYLAMNV